MKTCFQRSCFQRSCFQWSWAYGCTLTLLLLHGGWGDLASGQEAASDQAAAAAADQPESEPSAAAQPADPLEQLRQQHLELAIAIAADFDSPAQQQAAQVVAQQEVVDARFDAPVRAALEHRKGSGPFADQPVVAAIRMLKHTTIAPKDQVTLLLDLLIARSLDETSQEGRLLRQGRLEINLPGISAMIVSRLTFLQKPLAEELETRLAEDEPPVVLCAAAGQTGEHGLALVPRLLEVAAESDDRYVKAAVFQAVERIFESDRPDRRAAQNVAAAKAAGRMLSADEQNALAAQAKISPQSFEYATRILKRNDSNGDGVLTQDEWSTMLIDPSPADANRDGQITVEEYAAWMHRRSSR